MSLLCVQPAGCESAAIHGQANLLNDCDEGGKFDLNGVDFTHWKNASQLRLFKL